MTPTSEATILNEIVIREIMKEARYYQIKADNDLDNLIETLRNLGVDIEDPEKGINERSLKDEIINFVHHGECDFNKIIGKIMEQDVTTNAENADNLEQAVNCYVQYGEYNLKELVSEIMKQYNEMK